MARPYNNMSKKVQFKEKKSLSMSDLKKFRSSKKQQMSLDEAFDIVAGLKQSDTFSYKAAVSILEKYDVDFARSVQQDAWNESRAKKTLSLAQAYEIAGGFREADAYTFKKAMKLVAADDPQFAELLKEDKRLRDSANTATPEQIAENVEFITSVYSNQEQNEALTSSVMEDKEVKKAIKHTVFADEEKESAVSETFDIARTDTLATLADDKEFAEKDTEGKRQHLSESFKKSVLHTFASVRFDSQNVENAQEKINAAKKGAKGFFAKKIAKVRDAFNFGKTMKAKKEALINKAQMANNAIAELTGNLTNWAKEATGAARKKLSNAAVKTHKFMLSVMATSVILSSCHVSPRQPVASQDSIPQKQEVREQPQEQQNDDNTVNYQDVVVVPTEYADSMGIRAQDWDMLHKMYGDENFAKYYQRVDSTMMQDNKTREQVLFQYMQIERWNLPQHDEARENLHSYFNCDGEDRAVLSETDIKALDDVLLEAEDGQSIGAIRGVEGSMNTYVGQIDNDCGEHNLHVQYSKKHRAAQQQVETVSDQEEVVEETVEETVEEVAPVKDLEKDAADFSGTSVEVIEGAARVDTVYTTPHATILKGNNIEEGKVIGEVSADSLDVSQTNKKVVVETSTKDETDLFAQDVTASGKSVKDSVTTSTADVDLFALDVTASGKSVKDNVTTSTADVDLFAQDVTASGKSVDGNNEKPAIITTSTTETNSLFAKDADVSGQSYVSSFTDGRQPVEVSSDKVIEDSEDVKSGTPAAGNVDERGGYLNTGLTEKQFTRMQTFYKDRFGENAFEDYMAKITDDMRAKGGLFEGLSKAEALYSVQQMIAWSNDRNGKFAHQIEAVTNYFKGCDETISEKDSISIKNVIDAVNENGTIDGVTGRTRKRVRFYQSNDCGSKGTYNIVRVPGAPRVTEPEGPKFSRFYTENQFVLPELDVEHTSTYMPAQTTTETYTPTVRLYKGNNLNDGTEIGTVDANKLAEQYKGTDKKIVVEADGAENSGASLYVGNSLSDGKKVADIDAREVAGAYAGTDTKVALETNVDGTRAAKKQKKSKKPVVKTLHGEELKAYLIQKGYIDKKR